jgi:hypothetical protein
MAETSRDPLLLVASEAELPASQRVWGTGGWLPPEEREALDWLTFSRLLGWGVTVARLGDREVEADLTKGSQWVVFGCDPDLLGADVVRLLASRLETEPLLVLARAGSVDSPFARLAGVAISSEQFEGRSLSWVGPGPEWTRHCRRPLEAGVLRPSRETTTWATLDCQPVVVARRLGLGIIATLGFHPSKARDTDGAVTALFKHLLIWASAFPVAWFDWEDSLVLRMDDPGGAQNVHSRRWSHPKLDRAAWTALADDLGRRSARLTIGYVSGWVDDGDVARGRLQVAGQESSRRAGKVYDSPLVRYEDLAGHAPGRLHDLEDEFQGIQLLRAAGLGDVELHGHTHMHPDSVAWAKAPDRYDAQAWYRELGTRAATAIAARQTQDHPLALGVAALQSYFGVSPTTLICPGDEWIDSVLEKALELGLCLVSSYYQALRVGDRFCWCTHFCAPYLDEPDSAWFDSGLPVVGYFHDREPALEGVAWISRWLDCWQAAGARRLLDFRELASAVACCLSLNLSQDGFHLNVAQQGAPQLVRPLTVNLRMPGGPMPSRLSVSLDNRVLFPAVEPLDDCMGRVTLAL